MFLNFGFFFLEISYVSMFLGFGLLLIYRGTKN